MYRQIIRPLLFTLDPERMHNMLVSTLKSYRYLYPLRSIFQCCFAPHSGLFIRNGILFKNRIGLSAGFDKSGEIFDELSDFGFGFIELGTITPDSQKGNPAPRIFRLPKDNSLISRTGFNNCGQTTLSRNLKRRNKKSGYILGLNINKNPGSEGEEAIQDVFKLFRTFYSEADYFVLNWGSMEDSLFVRILQTLTAYREKQKEKRPILIKLPADILFGTLDKAIESAIANHINGFIATGPTMDRSNLKHYSSGELQQIGAGGVSGQGIGGKSLEIVRYLAGHADKDMLIIGAGGIMTAADAGRMINAGAHLVQIYSAFIYSGPSIIKKMGKKLFPEKQIREEKKDLSSDSQAI